MKRPSRWRVAALYGTSTTCLLIVLATVLTWAWLGRYESAIVWVRPTGQLVVAAFPRALIVRYQTVTWPMRSGLALRHGNFYVDTTPTSANRSPAPARYTPRATRPCAA